MPAIITIRRGNLRRVYNGSMSRYVVMAKSYVTVDVKEDTGRYDFIEWIADRTACSYERKGKLLRQERIYVKRKNVKMASKKSQEFLLNNLGMTAKWLP